MGSHGAAVSALLVQSERAGGAVGWGGGVCGGWVSGHEAEAGAGYLADASELLAERPRIRLRRFRWLVVAGSTGLGDDWLGGELALDPGELVLDPSSAG